MYKQRLKFICIDEVDCVSWVSFREKWVCLGKLRTFFPKVQILVASATVAASYWQYSLLVQSPKLRKVQLVRETPDRLNLRLTFSAEERPEDFKALLNPVVLTLCEQGEQAPIILIYCNDADLKRFSAILRFLWCQLGASAYTSDGKLMVEAYHFHTSDAKKRQSTQICFRFPSPAHSWHYSQRDRAQ